MCHLPTVYGWPIYITITLSGKLPLSDRTLSKRSMGRHFHLVYNLDTMQTRSPSALTNIERDQRLFVWFQTLIIACMYVVTLVNTPSVRQPLMLVLFTGVTLAHILLHWQMGKIYYQPRKTTWYTLAQGMLAFVFLLCARNQWITYILFMILLGQAIGIFGLTFKGLIAMVYFLVLEVLSLVNLSGWASTGSFMLNMTPITVTVILFVALYMRQNEAREQAQSLATQLETANRQLAEYAAQVEELTLVTERQRMARELHDTLSQGVAGLVLQLEAIKAHLEAGREARAAAIIDQSLARARSTLSDSRSVIDDLRAAPVNLAEAVRAKTERFTQATGIPCELILAQRGLSPSPNTSDHLLCVLNEALTNVTRHARADQVWVRLEAINNHLELEIRDDGQGFDPDVEKGTGHYGLLGMQERARLVGGILEIDSGSGRGTRIRLVVPIPTEG